MQNRHGQFKPPVQTIDNLTQTYLKKVDKHPGSSWHADLLHPKDMMPEYNNLPKDAKTALDDTYMHSVVGHSIF